jgi:Lrp/AsnC family leucine-responsive transcriptional regulator
MVDVTVEALPLPFLKAQNASDDNRPPGETDGVAPIPRLISPGCEARIPQPQRLNGEWYPLSFLNGAIDFTDRKILSALLSKGRSTFAELAAHVGLTAPTVHDRVKKLERSGIIEGYTAIINPSSLGYDITAMVSIVTDSKTSPHEYEKTLAEVSEIQKCYSVAGEETYILLVLTRTPKTLEKVLQRIKGIPGTVSTKASVVLSSPISRHTLPQEEDVREFPSETKSATMAR